MEAYKKAYFRDRNFTAWRNGNYTQIALEVSLNNLFAKNKSQRIHFPEWKDPFDREDLIEEQITNMQIANNKIKRMLGV